MRPADGGSAFIEALVASAIVSMSVLAMVQAARQSATMERSVETRRVAMLIAQSQLASVGSVVPLVAGRTTGSDGAYGWTIDIAQTADSALSSSALQLRTVKVSVGLQGAGTLVSLSSVRIAPP